MDARAKFELRRKKILQNAESRLQRITSGRFNSLHTGPPLENHVDHSKANGMDSTIVPPPCLAEPQPAPKTIPAVCLDREATPALALPRELDLDSIWNGFPPPVLNNNEPEGGRETKARLEKELETAKKADSARPREGWKDYAGFLTLAVVVRLSFVFNYGWMVSENVLAPFLIVSLPRLLYLAGRQDWSSGNPLYTLLLLAKFRPANIAALLSVLYVLRQLFQFLAFYMFAFIIVHCALEADPERT